MSKGEYRMLIETGLKGLSGRDSVADAVGKYLPSGKIGMKVNCLSRLNPTPVAMTEAIADVLVDTGFDENDIIIWERTSRELEQAGYKLNASSFGIRCLGTDANGYGYGQTFYSSGKVNSRISRVLTDLIDYNINLPVLKDHSIAGLSGCLKNMYGAVNNPNKYHGDNCDPYAADVSNLEPIKKRHRLSIVDATRIQYNGGPGFDSRYLFYYNGLVMSSDPVAADSICLEILEHLRAEDNLPPLEKVGRPVNFLRTAEQEGVGVADRNLIELNVINIGEDGRQSKGELF